MIIRGKGYSDPIGDNRTEEGMQKNRRVEITIVKTRAISIQNRKSVSRSMACILQIIIIRRSGN